MSSIKWNTLRDEVYLTNSASLFRFFRSATADRSGKIDKSLS